MALGQLRTFLALAETGSGRAAPAGSRVTQSAVPPAWPPSSGR